jgi:hypothetical protein
MQRVLLSLLFLLSLCHAQKVKAQVDPTLAGMIVVYTDKAEKELKSQEKAMLLESTGHIWIKEEMTETYNIQKKFNDYLNSFRDVVCFAAQIYGFYHEIDYLVTNMGKLSEQLEKHPSNSLAVALTPRQNQIYRDILLMSLDICNDIRQVCLSDVKMTEKQRVEIIFGIRPKLKKMNKSISRLTRAVKYTSLLDVWDEIAENAKSPADKGSIAKQAMRRWKRAGRNR